MNIWYGSGENSELSNLASREFIYDSHTYSSVEHAYQTLKGGSFSNATYSKEWRGGSKFIGPRANTKNNWNIALMEDLIYQSFKQNKVALALLLNTGDSKLEHRQDRGVWKLMFPKLLAKTRDRLNGEKDER